MRKLLYGVVIAIGLAACGGQEQQAPAMSELSTSEPPKLSEQELLKQRQQEEDRKIMARLETEEYFFGENNLDKIQLHEQLKDKAVFLMETLARGEKDNIFKTADHNPAQVDFNRAALELARNSEKLFGASIYEDKAGLFWCSSAAHAALSYYQSMQNDDDWTGNVRATYRNAVKECRYQIAHPPEPQITVYSRKVFDLPLKDCLSVLLTDSTPYNQYTCKMTLRSR